MPQLLPADSRSRSRCGVAARPRAAPGLSRDAGHRHGPRWQARGTMEAGVVGRSPSHFPRHPRERRMTQLVLDAGCVPLTMADVARHAILEVVVLAVAEEAWVIIDGGAGLDVVPDDMRVVLAVPDGPHEPTLERCVLGVPVGAGRIVHRNAGLDVVRGANVAPAPGRAPEAWALPGPPTTLAACRCTDAPTAVTDGPRHPVLKSNFLGMSVKPWRFLLGNATEDVICRCNMLATTASGITDNGVQTTEDVIAGTARRKLPPAMADAIGEPIFCEILVLGMPVVAWRAIHGNAALQVVPGYTLRHSPAILEGPRNIGSPASPPIVDGTKDDCPVRRCRAQLCPATLAEPLQVFEHDAALVCRMHHTHRPAVEARPLWRHAGDAWHSTSWRPRGRRRPCSPGTRAAEEGGWGTVGPLQHGRP